MPSVRIPTVLRRHTGGEAIVSAPGATVGEVLRAVADANGGLEEQLFDGDGLRGYVNVYLDDEDIRYLDGLSTPVGADDEIAIMPAVAGGSA
jgi:sulfur-carrier protein